MKVRLMSPSLPLRRLACVVGLLSIGSLGCLESRDQTGPAPGDNACGAKCHGNGKTPMPPPDTRGATNTSSPGVGAHELHIAAPSVKGSCNTCHVVPASVDQKGHADDGPPADVRFAESALLGERQPSYDPATRTCKNTYCHSGPGKADPDWPAQAVWTEPRSSAEACGSSCHAFPPAGTHPDSKNCVNCHGDTVGSDNKIKNASLHIDGKVDVGERTCNACHGNEQNSAPPTDLSGNSDTTLVGVGAHQKHLAGGDKTRPVMCSECHHEPANTNDPGHIDTDPPAEVIFSGVSIANGSAPTWDRGQARCSNTWCHGRPGGTSMEPVWTQVDGKQASCGGCHGIPPAAPHPQDALNCEYCHRDNAGPGLAIKDRNRHVDGKIDFAEGCSSCHGFPPAPALSGATETSDIGVGAHKAHIDGGSFSRKVACNECHVVPGDLFAAGHIDTGMPAEVTFSGVSVAEAQTPVWDHATATCTGSYCHGGTLLGGSNTNPVWTQAGQAGCGSCHGLPPPAPHPNISDCSMCHGSVVNAEMQIVDREKHINGTVDF